MTAAHTLPIGTILELHGDMVPTARIVRVDGGWDEVEPHCVDCACEWRAQVDGTLKGSFYVPDHAEDLKDVLAREDGWTVIAVPADWLGERIAEMLPLGDMDDDRALRQLAHDAGLI